MKIVPLGKVAKFLVPSVKIRNRKYSKRGQIVADRIHRFLVRTFGGYNSPQSNAYGYFGPKALTALAAEYDELREFRVAFIDDDRQTKLRQLQKFLAKLCADLDEECIYLEYDGVAMTISP
jgi:hypothetical protein